MDQKVKLDMYKKIVLSRRLEERVAELIKAGQVGGFMHPGVGQESLQVAAIETLRPDDYLLYAHRGVAYWVARGVPIEKVLCDLACKEGGTNHGKGGVMRVVYPKLGVLGESGTLGGCFPIAAGAGLSIKVKGEDKVVLVFFGDGTSNRGTFHESMNFCAVKKLPVVFLCENNGWAVSMPTERSTAVKDIAARAAGYDIPGKVVDGNDPEAVYAVVSEAVKRARSGAGPSLIEAKTYRLWGHWVGDPDSYRSREDVEKHWRQDPLPRYEQKLLAEKLLTEQAKAQIDAEARTQIDKAVEFMRAQPFPKPESALEDVFAETRTA
ncbi:MAG TPA: thiamine pyrophosphate-dependent dehydrogenase E1 component subunit alpha [Candidatus Binataceae bacterium]|nr:thiamine pyrophosphate-dependent dehydrogenase E1 component subunit alpha [Candidatus Binataceae bacterium]